MESVEQRLERKLRLRPTADELIDKNVLRAGDVAPALRAMRAEFERAKTEDVLNRKLANRPTRERLVDLNLIKGGDGLSPEMQRRQHEVQRSFMEVRLNRKLANRPTIEALAEKNLLKPGDPERLATREAIQRKLLESSLNSKLSAKYSTRWSAGKGNEAAPLLNSWDRKRGKDPDAAASIAAEAQASESPPVAQTPSPASPAPAATPFSAAAVEAQHYGRKMMFNRKISSFSVMQKSNFIQQLQAEGRFVCVNCCSEDFQGPELSSPRYSWNDFYNEEEWKLLGLETPKHNAEAKQRDLCNMCYGLCACGHSIEKDGACANCGSLSPISGLEQWRAPEHRRPRTYEEVEGRRAAQLQQFHHLSQLHTPHEILRNGQTTRRITFNPDVRVRYFQRFRFRNSFNDDCYLLSVPSPKSPVPADLAPELYMEDAEQAVPIAREHEGLLFFEPDVDGNIFAVAPFEANEHDRADGTPWRRDEDTKEVGRGLLSDDEDEGEDDRAEGEVNGGHSEPVSGSDSEGGSGPDSDGNGRWEDEDDTSRRNSSGPQMTMKGATELNSTRVFLYDPNKDLFYYADKSQGEIFCWNPVMGMVHRV